MNARELLTLLDNLAAPRVLIVGDLILDRYVSGEVNRISPEAPIPVLAAGHREERLGGAGNVAANLRAMEAEVVMLGAVGEDEDGAVLVQLLSDLGVDAGGCVRAGDRPTTVKTRLVSGVQQMLRMDWERVAPVAPDVEQELLAAFEDKLSGVDAVVVSDYGKGALTDAVLRGVIERARAKGLPVLVDPKGSDFQRYRGATLLTPNKKEAEVALGRKLEHLDEVPAAAAELQRVADLEHALITLGADGIFFHERDGRALRVPTEARAVFDVTGAGDTVISQLALALGGGLTLEAAVRLANHAAGLVVARQGAASVTRSELRGVLERAAPQEGKVLGEDELDQLVARWKREGKRVAFTNGCFDVLHAGHVRYLRFAASKGDVLLVGVNNDESVQRLKGPNRPVNPIGDRLEVLAALEMVDAVVAFGDDTPAALIERVTPQALIKGEDWADKGVVGREWVERHGGEVHLAPLLEGRSTTAILERGGGS